MLGLVGKAVTFDSGGISIKPSQGMHEMKMDMSGGAAVLESVAAIAELGLGLDVVAVVPSTENMPSGTALKPGDIITQLNGPQPTASAFAPASLPSSPQHWDPHSPTEQ